MVQHDEIELPVELVEAALQDGHAVAVIDVALDEGVGAEQRAEALALQLEQQPARAAADVDDARIEPQAAATKPVEMLGALRDRAQQQAAQRALAEKMARAL